MYLRDEERDELFIDEVLMQVEDYEHNTDREELIDAHNNRARA